MALEIEIVEIKDEEIWLASPKGDLDIYTSNEFKNNLLEAFEENQIDIIIDGKDLDYVDSTGLGALISIYKDLKERDREVSLINLKANIRKLFHITELDKLFNIRGEDNDQ